MSTRREVLRVLRRTLTGTVRRNPRATAALAGWSVLESAPTMLFGQAVARAVDGFRAGDLRIAGGWLAAMLLAALAAAVGSRRVYGCLAEIVEPLRDDLVRWVVRGALQRSLHGRPDTGAVARLTHQVEIVRDTFAGVLMVIRGFLFSVTGALIGLFTLMPLALPLVAPPLVLSLVVFGLLITAAAARQRDLIVGEEVIVEECTSMAQGLRDVVACGGEEAMATALDEHVEHQAAASLAVAKMAGLRALTISIGGWLPLLLVLAAAPWLVGRGATAGMLIGALTYIMHGLHPALSTLVTGLGGSGLRLAVTMIRIIETGYPASPAASASSDSPAARPAGDLAIEAGITREITESSEGAMVNGTANGTVNGAVNGTVNGALEEAAVELRGVTFAYGPHAHPVIENLDLFVPQGDHLAVVGPSGIGKSTLAALIAGMLTPDSGRITVAGRPPGDPRLRVFLPQESYVFDGTLRENLAYLYPAARDAEVRAAADAIGLRPLVRRIGGLDVPLDPAELSGGERQQIALARAYLAPMPLVVLDEATCHLDAAAEARAETAFARRPGTLILIAHRMTSALRARRILVLDGTSAHLGRHDDLLRVSELYRDLIGHWRSQPAALLGDPNGVHPVSRPDLVVDPGQVIAHRPDR